jgi:hypothetical protein
MHRLVIALVALIGLTGAAVVAGYLLVFGAATDRAAALVPAEAAVYANVYLQPSNGQRMNLAGLLGRVPGFEDESTLDEKLDQVAQNLLSGSGIDYREQVKPWLGNQIAMAAWPSAADAMEAEPILLVAVKDVEAARASVAELIAEDGPTFTSETYEGIELQVAEGTSYAIIDEMLVVAPAADHLRAVVDVSIGAPSLADAEAFREAAERLPTDHLASAFVDLAALAVATDTADALSGVSTASAALIAERDGLHLSGSAPFAMEEAEPSSRAGFAMGGEPSSLVEWMPDETLAEVVVFGLRQTLEDAEAAAAETPEGEEVVSTLDMLRGVAAFALGIDIDNDLLPLLDREAAVAVTDLSGELPRGQLLLRPEDPAAAAEALERLTDALSGVGGSSRAEEVDGNRVTIVAIPDAVELAWTVVDGIVILALDPDDVAAAIDAHRSGQSLGRSDAYRTAFEVAGTRGGNEAWADIAALVDLAGADADLPADVRDILDQLGALAITAPSRDDQIEFHAVLTVDETGPN